jgi:mannose-6-phosphate isomerase-like protein (cupin superfamily)
MRAAYFHRLRGLFLVCLCFAGLGPGASSSGQKPLAVSPPAHGLILQIGEGERRVRRPKAAGLAGLPDPFIIKVDKQNGGSKDLVMGYEELAPGQAIRPHRHLTSDEIIFVHSGTGLVSLGSREAQVNAGGTIYIPANTHIGLRNTGSAPLGIAFIFSKPGFEEILRENSVLEGQPATVLTAAERARNEARHRWHTVYEDTQK